MSNLTMQLSLKNISTQIEDVGRDVQAISEFVRREALSNKFIYARDKIMSAALADKEQQEQFLIEADTYLMEGLVDIYADVNAEIQKLAELSGPFRSLKAADTLLSHINEDMQMAASLAISSLVSDEELSEDYIMPFAFDERIGKTVAQAVADAAIKSGVARINK